MASIRGWRITRAGMIFIAVIIGLALLAFTVLHVAQQRGEQARQDEAAEIARENLEEQANRPIVIAEDETVNDGEAVASSDDDDQAAPEALPETGPELFALVGVFALVFATASFATSLRATRQL